MKKQIVGQTFARCEHEEGSSSPLPTSDQCTSCEDIGLSRILDAWQNHSSLWLPSLGKEG